MRFVVEPLARQDRTSFESGVEPLDRYFQRQVGQDLRRRVSACFVAVEQAAGVIAGYYMLAAAEIPLSELGPDIVRRLPRYPTVPAARLGRLAVDRRFRGEKLGAALLADAVKRASRTDIAVYAMIVDAKDDTAAAFYRHHGFMAYGSAPNKLVAPLASLIAQG